MTPLQSNARDLEQELGWFARLLSARFKRYFGQETETPEVSEIPPPELTNSDSPYAEFIRRHQLGFSERAALILALVPHIRPQLLDVFYAKNATFDRKFTEFGGVWGGPSGDFVPTGETLVFILAGLSLELRFVVQSIFDGSHVFQRQGILSPTATAELPPMKAPLRLSDDSLSYLTTGQARQPSFSANFPARLVQTELGWDDLVLSPSTRKQVDEITIWLRHGRTLMKDWGMAKKLRPGYRSLFYGPPGTGKTITACLLGKSTGQDVYKVDLSMVVSKYIGETEKNLAKVFDQAEHQNWILFFDEADALFGKRSQTRDSHDRYANQEVSFLLQRIESFSGIAILASNRRDNLDEAFARRFESIIHFPMPRPGEQVQLWRQGFSSRTQLEPTLDLEKVSRDYPLTGGAIMNVIRYASLQALEQGRTLLTSEDLLNGIRREHAKEGKGP